VVKVVDDKFDPAGASAAMKQLIDQDHVIAIVGENAPNTITVWAPIAAAAHVPVIGGDAVSSDWTSNPILFPVTTTSVTDELYGNVDVVKKGGYKRFGITYTTASPAAAAAGPFFKTLAENAGLKFTVTIPVNEADADFTAACLALKQSNTQAFFPATGGTEIPRMARDCARQNYFPAYILNTVSVGNNEILTDPNIKNVIAASASFPEPITNTPATKAFHAAMNKYAPKVLKSDEKTASTTVWTAAKLFEQVASSITSDAPTSQDVLNGLYQIKNETLGGLAPAPLTYTAGAESNPHVPCWFVLAIKNHKLVAPQGMKTNCAPPS
jgi:branched-chain amino acid transport system substrate-binding protein